MTAGSASQPPPGSRSCRSTPEHAKVKESLARWQALSAKAGGRYSYTRSTESVFGLYCYTTIHFDGGVATSLSELQGSNSRNRPGGITDMLVIENAGEFGTRVDACHPVVTLDALYEQCLNNVLCQDPKQNRISLEFDAAGLLLRCQFAPRDCFDDCSSGVSLKGVRVGDDAPECCPPEPTPRCCMSYGGAQVDGKCSMQCDGMPPPSAPWHRELDEYGCAQWVEPEPNGKCCGCP